MNQSFPSTIRFSLIVAFITLLGLLKLLISSQSNINNKSHTLDNLKISKEVTTTPLSIDKAIAGFVNKSCNLGSEKWLGTYEWQKKAPAFLIIGAKKCGTTSLFQYMRQHPNLIKPTMKELLMFIPHRFPHWEEPKNYDSKVMVEPARNDMYDNLYPIQDIKQNPKLMSYEATPDYLLYSTYSTKAILCTVPWVKILVTLRNPVDRVFSHYNFLSDPYLMRKHPEVKPKVSFDKWVQQDMLRLKEYGIIPKNGDIENFMGSSRERDAWRNYQKKGAAADRPLARSLYAIQLEEWFEALRSVGRDPQDSVFIIREEDLKSNPDEVVNNIFSWLGIQNIEIDAEKKFLVTNYTSAMTKETRHMLEEFYRPYNQRLYKLLGKEWQGIWD